MLKLMNFKEIKKLKKRGLNKKQVADRLRISPNTVKNYWDMTEEEFKQKEKGVHQKGNRSKISKFKGPILKELTEFPELASSQIHDHLEERFGEKVNFAERTTRNYVQQIREEYGIEKPNKTRDFQKVEELLPGYQAQVDYGEFNALTESGEPKRKKLYVFAMSLSYSRYKFVIWQDHPFTTKESIEAHEKAFEFFGGIPQEIVYDQDCRLIDKENRGEIIFTIDFHNYLNSKPFSAYVCRAADPQSKGKIESVIKYLKYNFARGRKYSDLEKWNKESLAWLDRRANGKEHQTTKEIPAIRFDYEKSFLQPLDNSFNKLPDIISYSLQKDNTLPYHSNFYEVPKGTYNKTKIVNVYANENRLFILNPRDHKIIVTHEISKGKGNFIKIPGSQKPQLSQTAKVLKDQVLLTYKGVARIKPIVDYICLELPRYAVDQFTLLLEVYEKWKDYSQILDQAAENCIDFNLLTALSFESLVKEAAKEQRIDHEEVTYSYYFTQEQKRREQEFKEEERNKLIAKAKEMENRFFEELQSSSLQDEEEENE